MALILHCDGCHAQDGSLDGNKQLPPQGAPVATNQAPPRIKVWRNVNVYGKDHDLCNRCVGKINAALQLPGDEPSNAPIPHERSDRMPLAGSH